MNIEERARILAEHIGVDVDELAFLTLLCDGCGAQLWAKYPQDIDDPPGWSLGEFGAEQDYCPACVKRAMEST